MKKEIVSIAQIAQWIRFLRGQKVLLDSDLAALYQVSTGALNQAVRRNRARFPDDFIFRLTPAEEDHWKRQIGSSSTAAALKSQIVISKQGRGGRRSRPYAFTEQGVDMLSSVLHSVRAVQVNIAIMRAFVKLRQALEANRELAKKFAQLEDKVGKHDDEIAAIIDAIRQLMAPPKKPAREIGFHVRESSPRYGSRKRR
jgi:ORF6N domain-containing protein